MIMIEPRDNNFKYAVLIYVSKINDLTELIDMADDMDVYYNNDDEDYVVLEDNSLTKLRIIYRETKEHVINVKYRRW